MLMAASGMRSRMLHALLLRPATSLNATMRANPLKSSIIVTTAKAGIADLFVQTVIEQQREVDRRRLSTFVLFGCFYQGCFQYWMFNIAVERIFPGRALRPTLQKILAVNLVGDPVFFFPCFYTLKEMLAREPSEVLQFDTVRCALSNYYENCVVDWRNTWATWLPGHAVTYGVLPMHLRMPWVAGVSFGYLALLSFTRGARSSNEQPQQPDRRKSS